eukprot:g61237.t1
MCLSDMVKKILFLYAVLTTASRLAFNEDYLIVGEIAVLHPCFDSTAPVRGSNHSAGVPFRISLRRRRGHDCLSVEPHQCLDRPWLQHEVDILLLCNTCFVEDDVLVLT